MSKIFSLYLFLFKSVIVYPFVLLVILIAAIFTGSKRKVILGPQGEKCVSVITPDIAIFMLYSVVGVKDPMFVELFRVNKDKAMVSFSGLFYKYFDEESAHLLMYLLVLNKVFGYSLDEIIDRLNNGSMTYHQRNKAMLSAQRWLTQFGDEAMRTIKDNDLHEALRQQVEDVTKLLLYIERNQPTQQTEP